jgi:hypothetical protein
MMALIGVLRGAANMQRGEVLHLGVWALAFSHDERLGQSEQLQDKLWIRLKLNENKTRLC